MPWRIAHRPRSTWNRIPDEIREHFVALALDHEDLTPRELPVEYTDENRYFVSESSAHRILKTEDLIGLTERKEARRTIVYELKMRPRFYPSLVNDRFGDPGVYVDFLMERRAMLFDLGDIRALPSRAILRVSDVFVSHAHIDHFIGFDHLLRVLVGREKRLRLYGPAGFIDRVEAKLNAYTWNLADRFRTDLVFAVTEISDNHSRRARFRLKNRFLREEDGQARLEDGAVLDETSLRVRYAELEHRTPCLAFALQETAHINVWKNRLQALGLAVGPWLATLKRAIHDGLPDETPIRVQRSTKEEDSFPLGQLRERIVSVTQGQKIGYVTDAAPSQANARAIVELVRDADILFIEASFAEVDTELAAERAHLTAGLAGRLARDAGVGRVEPFHFSARYANAGAKLIQEVETAFQGAPNDA